MFPHPITLMTHQILNNFNIDIISQTLKLYLPSLIECTEGRIGVLTVHLIFFFYQDLPLSSTQPEILFSKRDLLSHFAT